MLTQSESAVWDVGSSSDECLPGTRQDILRELTSWFQSDTRPRVCLLHGIAGTGKTAIAKSICRDAQERQILGGNFFCSRRNENRRDVGRIILSIAFQLATANAPYGRQLSNAIKGWNGVIDANPADQWNRLIVGPFEKMTPGFVPILIVMDGIDECEDRKGRRALWTCLLGPIPNSLKVLVTSWPDSHVRASNLYSINLDSFCESSYSDIQLYVQNSLQKLSPPGEQWLLSEDVSSIVKRSSCLFIYAAEACRQVEGPGSAVMNLSNLLNNARNIPVGIERFDGRICVFAVGSFSDENIALCRSILGMIALWKEQKLSLSDLSALLGHDAKHIRGLLVGFHSVLRIPEDLTEPVHVYHHSLTEFLTAHHAWQTKCDLDGCENSQCQGHPRLDFSRLYMPKKQHHLCITVKLLQYMTRRISTDIGIEQHAVGTSRLVGLQGSATDGALEYACKHWAEHLFLSDSDSRRDVDQLAALVIIFLETKGGSWLEGIVNTGRDSFHEQLRDLQSADIWQRLHASIFAPETQKALEWLIKVGISKLETSIHSKARSAHPREMIRLQTPPMISPIFPHDAHRAPLPRSAVTNPHFQMPVASIFGSPDTQSPAGMGTHSYIPHTLRHYHSWQEEESPAVIGWRQPLFLRPSKSSCFAEEMV
ncbi:hypothetical protein DFS33DRAFT_1272371 [Desarmillaria ectypa]|nr:hypothetical protein DFS33DRAFT_1272371 [Desarmillaria ectypa]